MDSLHWKSFADQKEPYFLELCRKLDLKSMRTARDLPADLLLYRNPKLSVFYAPFGLQSLSKARLMIVGLTPGFAQAWRAYEAWQQADGDRERYESLFVKNVVFAGPTRQNLIRYLDELGVANVLEVPSTAELFTRRQDLIAAYSMLRYPVFVGQDLRNYGGTDAAHKDPWLQTMIQDLFCPHVLRQGDDTLFVPLGKYPSRVLQELAARIPTLAERTLFGFPHTSGSNAHRHAQIEAGRTEFISKIKTWGNAQKLQPT